MAADTPAAKPFNPCSTAYWSEVRQSFESLPGDRRAVLAEEADKMKSASKAARLARAGPVPLLALADTESGHQCVSVVHYQYVTI